MPCKVELEDRFRDTDERDVAAKLKAVTSGNDVDVVREFISALCALNWGEELAADKGCARNIERHRVAIRRFESGATLAEIETRFVDDFVGKCRSQRGDCRSVFQGLDARA